MKKRIAWVLLFAVLLPTLLTGCRKVTCGNVSEEFGVVRDEEFGNVYIEPTIEEFNALGFAFGDSVDIEFGDGRKLEDIPYYSGYYVSPGEPLLCGYPGYPHPVIARNYGSPTWEEFGLTETSRVTVTLRECGKYAATEQLYSLAYSDDRSTYDSDIQFANFRELRGGNLRAGAFYRSASPCDNQHKRASITNRLVEEAGIGFVLNLSDSEAKYAAHKAKSDFDSAYYDGLVEEGKVLFLAMNANYRGSEFASIMAEAFKSFAAGALLLMATRETKDPCLIHCVEGKDRTGFVCTILLALADATADEIIDDYMITYANYYKITKERDPAKYEAVKQNVLDFLYCICEEEKTTPLSSLNIKEGAENYLRRGGLSDDEIARIEAGIR